MITTSRLGLLLFLMASCTSTRVLVYDFDNSIDESLATGVNKLKQLLEIKRHDLFYAMIYNNEEGGLNIIVNAINDSDHPVFQITKKSNRTIDLNGRKIPVIFLSDKYSVDSKNIGLAEIPLGGYLVSFDRYNKIIKTGLLF